MSKLFLFFTEGLENLVDLSGPRYRGCPELPLAFYSAAVTRDFRKTYLTNIERDKEEDQSIEDEKQLKLELVESAGS